MWEGIRVKIEHRTGVVEPSKVCVPFTPHLAITPRARAFAQKVIPGEASGLARLSLVSPLFSFTFLLMFAQVLGLCPRPISKRFQRC